VFGYQPEQMVGPAPIRVVDDDDASAQTFARRMTLSESAQIHHGHWPAAIIEHAGDAVRRLRHFLQGQQGHNLDYAAGLQRVTVFAQLE